MAKHAKPGDLRRRVRGLALSGLDVLVVDEGLVFVVGRLRPIEEVDSFGDDFAAITVDPSWSCHAYVPVSELIYAAFRSNAKGLLPPSDEWRRRGL